MKLYRNVIILAVVLALAVGAYFVVKKNHKPEADPITATNDTTIELVNVKDSDVDNVTLLNNGVKIVIGQSNDKWSVIYPENFKSDEPKSKSVVWNLNPLNANKVIEENAADLAKYGFDKSCEVTVKMKDGTEKTIQFGKKTATGENYYVKMKDSNTVYAIAKTYGDKFLVKLYDLKSTDIFEETPDMVKQIAMWKNGKTVFSATAGEMSAEQKEAYAKIDSVAAFWNVTVPVETEADTTKITRMINTLVTVSAKEYITEKADDLSKYGLDKPSYEVEITTDSGSRKIQFGKQRPVEETSTGTAATDTQTYAKFENSDEIFTVGTSTLTFIDTPIKDIVSDINLMVFVDDISHFTFSLNGKTDEFDVTHDPNGNKDNDKFTMNGKDASMKDSEGTQIFRTFYQSVAGVRFEEVDLESKPEGQPEATFIYTYKTNGTIMKIDFVSKDNYYYFVMKNGKYTGLTVLKKYFAPDSALVTSYNALKTAVDSQ